MRNFSSQIFSRCLLTWQLIRLIFFSSLARCWSLLILAHSDSWTPEYSWCFRFGACMYGALRSIPAFHIDTAAAVAIPLAHSLVLRYFQLLNTLSVYAETLKPMFDFIIHVSETSNPSRIISTIKVCRACSFSRSRLQLAILIASATVSVSVILYSPQHFVAANFKYSTMCLHDSERERASERTNEHSLKRTFHHQHLQQTIKRSLCHKDCMLWT